MFAQIIQSVIWVQTLRPLDRRNSALQAVLLQRRAGNFYALGVLERIVQNNWFRENLSLLPSHDFWAARALKGKFVPSV
jgi:hypothetical protein